MARKKKIPKITANPFHFDSEPKLSADRMALLGALLVLLGMTGFYFIPGLIAENAGGSKVINAFYCSVITLTTVGFGDICPGETDTLGTIFLTFLPIFGLGFFCGPILDMASAWQRRLPGGTLGLGIFTIVTGVSVLATLEDFTFSEAVHLCIITGTTIGYGNITPSTDLGRFALAIYAILVCNVMGGFLDMGRKYLESWCHEPRQTNKDD